MRQTTVLALALLLATPLLALALPAGAPAPLFFEPVAPSGEAASCAAPPTTGAPQVLELSVGAAAVTCSSYCGHPQCLGQPAGEYCLLGPGTVGLCTPSTLYCSTDGIKRCSCIQEEP